MDKYKFGEFIYNRRTTLGLTQDELGRKCGVTNKAVSKWEVGETLPDVQIFPLLAGILEVTTDELYACEMKPRLEEVKVEPTKNISKGWKITSIILIILLFPLLLGYLFFIPKGKENEPKLQNIALTKEIVNDYVLVTPCLRSVNDNETLTLYGEVSLKDKEVYVSPITLTLVYSIQYFYTTTSNSTSLISYLNKEVEVIYEGEDLSYSITFTPKTPLTNFSSFLEMNIHYEVKSVTGNIEIMR